MNSVTAKMANQKKPWTSDVMKQSAANAQKNKMHASNSCKIVGGVIMEGGSSSSEENKRPSTVQEQKTEEDAEDSSVSVLNQKWNHLMSQQNLQENNKNENQDSHWSNDAYLF